MDGGGLMQHYRIEVYIYSRTQQQRATCMDVLMVKGEDAAPFFTFSSSFSRYSHPSSSSSSSSLSSTSVDVPVKRLVRLLGTIRILK